MITCTYDSQILFFLVNYKRLLEAKARIENGGSPHISSHLPEKGNEALEFPYHTVPKAVFRGLSEPDLVVATPINFRGWPRNVFRGATGLGKDRLSHLIRFMHK